MAALEHTRAGVAASLQEAAWRLEQAEAAFGVELLRARRSGLTLSQIGAAVGLTRQSVHGRLRRLELRRRAIDDAAALDRLAVKQQARREPRRRVK